MDDYQRFIYTLKYARFDGAHGRREVFDESMERYCGFVFRSPLIPEKVIRKSREKLFGMEVAPSMRAFQSAGPAALKNNATMYNCSAIAMNDLDAFGEAMFLLMCGVGVGFSCEHRHIDKLPAVKKQGQLHSVLHWMVEDSREGWKEAVDAGIDTWFEGKDIYFDFSRLRPMGAVLRTMGGRSSGPDVLRQLLSFIRETIMGAQGRRLTSLEVHDIMCEIASVVVAGGVRRSALISLSDLDDPLTRAAKAGEFHRRRWHSNNSAVYHGMPDQITFLHEWTALAQSGTGERGIANIWGARRNSPHRRKGRFIEMLNPCGEVALRDREFCNLTEAIVRMGDDFETLRDKVTTATWLGVIQSTFSQFPNLSEKWQLNSVDERLCGVSLTGQMDNPGLLTDEVLKLLKQHAVNVARKAAKELGINVPAAVTCVKPSGTVSKMYECAAGVHPRWSEYYIQRVQVAKIDPLYAMIRDQGIPIETIPGSDQVLVPFPRMSPEGAITRHDMTAMDQLEHYRKVTKHWCEHNASCTVYVAKDEWIQVADWVYRNFEDVNGLSFYPKEEDGGNYAYRPFQEITEEEYDRLVNAFPRIDFDRLPDYEKEDCTAGSRELACAGGQCELG